MGLTRRLFIGAAAAVGLAGCRVIKRQSAEDSEFGSTGSSSGHFNKRGELTSEVNNSTVSTNRLNTKVASTSTVQYSHSLGSRRTNLNLSDLGSSWKEVGSILPTDYTYLRFCMRGPFLTIQLTLGIYSEVSIEYCPLPWIGSFNPTAIISAHV